MTTACLPDSISTVTDTDPIVPYEWANVGSDGVLNCDKQWLEKNAPTREVLKRKVRDLPPPYEWYDADMECPF